MGGIDECSAVRNAIVVALHPKPVISTEAARVLRSGEIRFSTQTSPVTTAPLPLPLPFAFLVVIPEEPALSEVEWGICFPLCLQANGVDTGACPAHSQMNAFTPAYADSPWRLTERQVSRRQEPPLPPKPGAKRLILLPLFNLEYFFRVFSPEIACQVPKPPNPLSLSDIRVAC
jgi:hypothetical protein